MLVAVGIVFGLSFLSWSRITDGWIKDFDLFADLRVDSLNSEMKGNEFVDPEFLKEMEQGDSQTETEASGEMAQGASQSKNASEEGDASAEPLPAEQNSAVAEVKPAVEPRKHGEMVIEDYTQSGSGLSRLKKALSNGSARIGVIGDSYIEGDIFTQDIRDQLQNSFGGKGVGYVPAYSQVSGFRRTVGHTSNGWKQVGIQKASSSPYFSLMGEYFVGENGATTTFKGVKDSKLSSWRNSQVLFIAPVDGKITLTTDTDTVTYDVKAGPEVQMLSLEGETSVFKIKNNVPGLIFIGAYLDNGNGVNVDCMSIRGDSGITHRKINKDLASQIRQYVDYDLIIVEYGINALTAQQKNYDRYGNLMAEVVERIKECYPKSDILLLGIGDRGQKVNGQVHSLPTAKSMVDAQRRAAQKAGCLFWDTREAMGGEDAIVDWRNRKLVNADYIHLNSAGGKVLATELVKSLKKEMGE